MTPWHHAVSSAQRFGGTPDDYITLHDWFDETKTATGDWTHRALRHHSLGVQWAIEKFGHTLTNSEGRQIPVKLLAEQHIQEDCGFIPTPQDYLQHLQAQPWMLRVSKKSTTLTLKDSPHA